MALDYSIIGQRIKQARLAKNYTQDELSEKLDVSEGYILNGASSDSENYLTQEFNDLIKSCTADKQRLIYKVAKIIAEAE